MSATPQPFLILSNGRSGSTWLATALGRLAGMTTDYEYRWNFPDAPLDELHRLIPGHIPSVADDLRAFARGADFVGSRLVLSLEWSDREDFARRAEAYFDPSIHYVLLTRRFFDVLLSFMLRGPTHQLTPADQGIEADNVLRRRLRDYEGYFAGVQANYAVAAPRLFEALASLTNNAIALYGLYAQRPRRSHVAYEAIDADFLRLAREIGWRGEASDAQAVMDKPFTVKLPAFDLDRVPERAELEGLCAALDEDLRQAIATGAPVESLASAMEGRLAAYSK